MKILINLTNLKKGGGIQVANSLLLDWKIYYPNHVFYIVCRTGLKNELVHQNYANTDNFFITSVEGTILKVIRFLQLTEAHIKPDIVCTLFGPSLWRPASPHVVGFAIPHYVTPESPYFDLLSPIDLLKAKFRKIIKGCFFERNSDFFIVETDSIKRRLSKYLHIDQKKIFVINNTCHQCFDSFIPSQSETVESNKKERINLVTISANYPHKNLKILPQIAKFLHQIDPGRNYHFTLTLQRNEMPNFESSIENDFTFLGKLSIEQCPFIYSQADVMVLPTLLECFSASYVEAMKMKTPIVTTDLEFAHEVCGDAALYYSPLNPLEAAQRIKDIVYNKNCRDNLIENGIKRLGQFPTHHERSSIYIQVFQEISSIMDSRTL